MTDNSTPELRSLFEARGATYRYEAERDTALAVDNLTVLAGDRIALVGPSPAGKSTMIGVMAGALPLQWGGHLNGHVKWRGSAPLSRSPDAFRVSSLLEHPAERWSRASGSCTEEFSLDLASWGADAELGQRRMRDLIERFGLSELMGRNPWLLSGGESQRVAIASTLLAQANLYLVDEPLANLDAEWRQSAVEAIHTVPGDSSAAVVATAEADAWERGRFSIRRVEPQRSKTVIPVTEASLSQGFPTRGLQVRIRDAGYAVGKPVLRNLEVDVRPGDVAGVVGRNGRGKTTLFRAIMGLLPVIDGDVHVEGVPDFSRLRLYERAAHIAFVVQDAARQFAHSTVERELLGISVGRPSAEARQAYQDRELVTAAFGITQLHQRHPRALSHGERRRVGLASMLGLRRPIVMLDEPTVGLDEAGRAMVEAYIRTLARAGCAVLVASHDSSLLDRVCTYVVAL